MVEKVFRYPYGNLDKVIDNDAKRKALRKKIVDRVMTNLLREAQLIAKEEELSQVNNELGTVFVLGQIKEALEAGLEIKIADAVYAEVPLSIMNKGLGYTGSSTNLRRRHPQINELVKTRNKIEILHKGKAVKIGDWQYRIEPLGEE